MERIEVGASKAKNAGEALKVEQNRVEVLKVELDKEVEVAKAGLNDMKANRSTFVKDIDPDTYDLYMDLLASKRGVAVTLADDESVSGNNKPKTLFLPNASTQSAAQTALSTPPEIATTNPLRFNLRRKLSRIRPVILSISSCSLISNTLFFMLSPYPVILFYLFFCLSLA